MEDFVVSSMILSDRGMVVILFFMFLSDGDLEWFSFSGAFRQSWLGVFLIKYGSSGQNLAY